ncbi:MAG: hypothetical protein ACRELE_05445 [Gemmatimonadales bacterium]
MTLKPRTLLTIAVVVLFIAFLAWTTLAAQKVTCNVCVSFNGQTNCASASHENVLDASRSAQTTACGPVSHGMNETIACGNRPPLSQKCQVS